MAFKQELKEAIRAGNIAEVRRHFEPQDLDSSDYCGSLLHFACDWGTLETVQFLVEQGAELNAYGGLGRDTPLSGAAYMGKIATVRFLVEAGARLDVSTSLTNPLMRAASEGHHDVVEYLLTTDIDRNACYRIPTGALINALVEAEWNGHTQVIELLQANGCRHPVEGEDIPLWEPPPERMVNQSAETIRYQETIRYMAERFGPADPVGLQELLPLKEGISVAVNVIRPNDDHPYLVLFTNGMSDLPMTTPSGQERWEFAELVMHLPADWMHPREAKDEEWLWPIKQLRKLAYYPHLNETWLGLPATIVANEEPPTPVGPGTEQTCLLALPNIGKLASPLERSDGSQVNFFTVTTLYTSERDFELEHGAKAFLNRFKSEEIGLDVVLDRPSFAIG